jgi:ribose transport system permease protein
MPLARSGADGDGPGTERRPLRWAAFARANPGDYTSYVVFLVVFLAFAILLNGQGFLNANNLVNIVRQSAVIAVMAVGVVFVLSTAEIDLSVGSVAAMSAVGSAMALERYGFIASVATGLAIGGVVGLINGLLTTKLRIPSFLGTLGMAGVLGGLARTVSNLVAIPVYDDNFIATFGGGDLGPFPTLFIWMAAVVFVGHVVLRRTPFGREVLATGGNRTAARFAGIRTDRVRILGLVIASVCAAIGGMILAGELHGARYDLAATANLNVIAAAVIGGTSLFGGKGTVVGAVVGSVLMAMLTNGLILMNISVSNQMIAQGVIIIIAVGLMSLSEWGERRG